MGLPVVNEEPLVLAKIDECVITSEDSPHLLGRNVCTKQEIIMLFQRCIKIAVQVFVALFCSLLFSSCSTVGSTISYLIQLPLKVINALVP